MRADPLLMESFACEMDAAVYHSSLVGTTTFQQRAVTHQMLRAAASHTLATCVRARRTAELRKDAKAQAEATAKQAQHQALYQAMEAAELHPSWRTRTRAASRAEVEEAEEAARVQAEAALALGSADGGVHGCVLAQAATNDDGDYLAVDIEAHTTHDTILPIGTEVEVFFDANKWERAVVTGHIPDIGARDAVYYNHVFLYESDGSVLTHFQGTIMLRMRRSVHDELQRTKTPTATGGRTRRAR